MSTHPLFANFRRDLVPNLAEAGAAVRDRQLYASTASDRQDPGAADRIEVESEADSVAAMAIDPPTRAPDMSMKLERGGRRG
jgi:hypothetical protein